MRFILLIMVLLVFSTGFAQSGNNYTQMDLRIKHSIDTLINPIDLALSFDTNSLKLFEQRHPKDMDAYHLASKNKYGSIASYDTYERRNFNTEEYSAYIQGYVNPDDPALNVKLKQAKRLEIVNVVKACLFVMLLGTIGLLSGTKNKVRTAICKYFGNGYSRILLLTAIVLACCFSYLNAQYFFLVALSNNGDVEKLFVSRRLTEVINWISVFCISYILFWGTIFIYIWILNGFKSNSSTSR